MNEDGSTLLAVDVNIIAYLLIEGEQSAAARALWSADPDWRLPALWRDEFLNVLTTLGRTQRSSRAELLESWRASQTLFAAADIEVDGEVVLDIAMNHQLSAYDARYVAVARQLGTILVTEDRKLRQALPSETVSLAAWLSSHSTS